MSGLLHRNGAFALFKVSARFAEFPQAGARPREPRADRSNRETQGEGCLLVRELLPSAKGKNVLVAPRQTCKQVKRRAHAELVVDSRGHVVAQVGGPLTRQTLKGRAVTALRPPAVPEDVRRYPQEPGKGALVVKRNRVSTPPTF
jgi:hypothetical protein